MPQVQHQFDSISLREAADLIMAVGTDLTVLLRGEMGIGKSSMLETLAEQLPDHVPVYVEAPCWEGGDIQMPNFSADKTSVKMVPNESLGLHLDKPIIFMADEIGKASNSTKTSLARIFLERKLGNHAMHPDSFVFATTNLAMEGVGDTFAHHLRTRFLQGKVRKPTAMEWVEDYAIPKGVNPIVVGTAMEYPSMFESFEQCELPQNNPYIFHPKAPAAAFTTPRSLAKAGYLLDQAVKHNLPDAVLAHGLMGLVGEAAAMDILTMYRLDNTLPSWDTIIQNPAGAPIPESGAAGCILSAKAVQRVERETLDAWLVYLLRMAPELQVLFMKSLMRHSEKKKLASTHRRFIELCSTHAMLVT
jgi:hypothetical protein